MQSRRRFLLGGGAVFGATTLAGCSSLLGSDDDSFDFGEFSDYRDWVGTTDVGPVNIFAANPADIVNYGVLGDEATGDGIFGTPTGRVAHLVDVTVGEVIEGFDHQALVAVGEYEPVDARDSFEADQSVVTEPAEEYAGYQVFTVAEDDVDSKYALFAARDDVALAASDREVFETVVDAERAETGRLIDDNREFGLAAEVIGNQDWNQYTVRFEEEIGHARLVRGTAFEFGSSDSDFTEVSVYSSQEAAESDESAVRSHWVDVEPGTSDVETVVDGRVLVVTGTQDNEHLL